MMQTKMLIPDVDRRYFPLLLEEPLLASYPDASEFLSFMKEDGRSTIY